LSGAKARLAILRREVELTRGRLGDVLLYDPADLIPKGLDSN
jgi:hypothetical protein